MNLHYTIPGDNFSLAGFASADVKKKLKEMGYNSAVLKRVAIAMYEAEINMAVHAGGGEAFVEITDTYIKIIMKDCGPGIPCVEKALKEGYSTAPRMIQELGFGAGMGLHNMQENSDELDIESTMGKGTTVTMTIQLPPLDTDEIF
ncbi:MAG TPA: ATP-binding protein [Treponemataceae bacterium]|jgi:serine/threonine-protein kinase RsbT|nr:ATP-binding protein [Treponemataceae bacterium]HQL04721.1 ATP-binding protein [Treponemataceae bacterium]